MFSYNYCYSYALTALRAFNLSHTSWPNLVLRSILSWIRSASSTTSATHHGLLPQQRRCTVLSSYPATTIVVAFLSPLSLNVRLSSWFSPQPDQVSCSCARSLIAVVNERMYGVVSFTRLIPPLLQSTIRFPWQDDQESALTLSSSVRQFRRAFLHLQQPPPSRCDLQLRSSGWALYSPMLWLCRPSSVLSCSRELRWRRSF